MLTFILFPLSFLTYRYRKYISIFSQIVWYKIIHYFLNSIIEHKGDKVILSYVINGHLRKFVVDNKKGPDIIYSIKDENNDDVSELACYEFNNLTPKFWNKKQLKFEMLNGKVLVFSENDVIKIDQK